MYAQDLLIARQARIIVQQAQRIAALERAVAERDALLAHYAARIAALERRLGMNSSNSSQPPAADGLRKKPAPRSLREPGAHPSGGQPGHAGHTLRQTRAPDAIVAHALPCCPACQSTLSTATTVGVCQRQVVDLTLPAVHVTEHQATVHVCPACGRRVRAAFPAGVAAPVQYGAQLQALAVYLNQQQFIPEDRLRDVFAEVFGLAISTASLRSMGAAFAARIAPFQQTVAQRLRQCPVKHADESGVRVAGRLHWGHVLCNTHHTWYRIEPKRGAVPHGVAGTLVHDHFKPYFALDGVTHGLCGAHVLRELNGLAELAGEPWAAPMARVLRLVCRCAGRAPVSSVRLARLVRLYRQQVEAGLLFHERQAPPVPGRRRRRPGHNLAIRLHERQAELLRCLADPAVPFTNNCAERDIRMRKLRQKISGGFRTLAGAREFALIRGYLSTMRKHGVPLLHAIAHPQPAIASSY